MSDEQKPLKIEWVGIAYLIEDDKSMNPMPIDFATAVPINSMPFTHPYPCPICDAAEYDRRKAESNQ